MRSACRAARNRRHQGVVIPSLRCAPATSSGCTAPTRISARATCSTGCRSQVAHLSRVEAMNAMAATLAHELNQPLTAASNYLAGSRRRLGSGEAAAPDEIEHGMAAAEQQVHLAANIIRRVREMVVKQPQVGRHGVAVAGGRQCDRAALASRPPIPRLVVRKEIARRCADASGATRSRSSR